MLHAFGIIAIVWFNLKVALDSAIKSLSTEQSFQNANAIGKEI